jgi:hypothetical protein
MEDASLLEKMRALNNIANRNALNTDEYQVSKFAGHARLAKELIIHFQAEGQKKNECKQEYINRLVSVQAKVDKHYEAPSEDSVVQLYRKSIISETLLVISEFLAELG